MQFKLSDLNHSIVKIQLLQDASSSHYDYQINNAADVDKLVGPELRKLDREYLLAIYLTSRNKIIDIEVVAIGCLIQVPVHPREVIKSAVLANAPALEGGIALSWFTTTPPAISNPPKKIIE